MASITPAGSRRVARWSRSHAVERGGHRRAAAGELAQRRQVVALCRPVHAAPAVIEGGDRTAEPDLVDRARRAGRRRVAPLGDHRLQACDVAGELGDPCRITLVREPIGQPEQRLDIALLRDPVADARVEWTRGTTQRLAEIVGGERRRPRPVAATRAPIGSPCVRRTRCRRPRRSATTGYDESATCTGAIVALTRVSTATSDGAAPASMAARTAADRDADRVVGRGRRPTARCRSTLPGSSCRHGAGCGAAAGRRPRRCRQDTGS